MLPLLPLAPHTSNFSSLVLILFCFQRTTTSTLQLLPEYFPSCLTPINPQVEYDIFQQPSLNRYRPHSLEYTLASCLGGLSEDLVSVLTLDQKHDLV